MYSTTKRKPLFRIHILAAVFLWAISLLPICASSEDEVSVRERQQNTEEINGLSTSAPSVSFVTYTFDDPDPETAQPTVSFVDWSFKEPPPTLAPTAVTPSPTSKPEAAAPACTATSDKAYLVANIDWSRPGHVAADKSDLLHNPQRYTKENLLLRPSVESGFALLYSRDDGTYGYGYDLTAEGNVIVLKYLIGSMKMNNFLVSFTGSYCSHNSTFILSSLNDISNGDYTKSTGTMRQTRMSSWILATFSLFSLSVL